MRTMVSRYQIESDVASGGRTYGVTCDENTGRYTIRPVVFDDGFQVAGQDRAEVYAIPAGDTARLVEAATQLIERVVEGRAVGADVGEAQVGLWVDDHGTAWLELSRWVEDREEAIDAARAAGEEAIWAWAAGEAVAVD